MPEIGIADECSLFVTVMCLGYEATPMGEVLLKASDRGQTFTGGIPVPSR